MPHKCPVCTVHSGAVAVFLDGLTLLCHDLSERHRMSTGVVEIIHIPAHMCHGYDDHEESTVVRCSLNSQTAQDLGSTASLYNPVRSKVPQDTA